jgi:hypothetical protein
MYSHFEKSTSMHIKLIFVNIIIVKSNNMFIVII